MTQHYDYIIAGGGGSGLITAFRMSRDPWFDNKSILIIEKEQTKGNDRTWCYWEAGGGEWDHLIQYQWKKIYFGSPSVQLHTEIDPFQYKMLRSSDLYTFLNNEIHKKKNFTFVKEEVTAIREFQEYAEVATSSHLYKSDYILNSIPQFNPIHHEDVFPYLKQHFVGWFIKSDKPVFNPEEAVFMDFDIPQDGNTRFIYVLPFSSTEALVEYTLFSEDLLSYDQYEEGIKAYMEAKGISKYHILEKESGNIPMTCFPFHHANGHRILHIGSAGGWTKASTGFTFRNITKNSVSLISFLKTEKPLKQFYNSAKYRYYDQIFIEVLANNNACGVEVFSSLFRSVPVPLILRFLNDETTLAEDLKIILKTKPKTDFTAAFFRTALKLIKNKSKID